MMTRAMQKGKKRESKERVKTAFAGNDSWKRNLKIAMETLDDYQKEYHPVTARFWEQILTRCSLPNFKIAHRSRLFLLKISILAPSVCNKNRVSSRASKQKTSEAPRRC